MDTKTFTRYVEEQVPARLKTNTYLAFLNLIKKRNIRTTEDLEQYLFRREEAISDFLKTGKGSGTMANQLREKAEEMGFIQHIKRNFLKYL